MPPPQEMCSVSQVVETKLAINLVHELVDVIAKWADREKLLEEAGMEPRSQEHLAAVREELGVDELLALGIWIDGVPFNWDRSESLEVISLNFPGLTGEWKSLRIPIASIPKDFVATGETFDDILEIVVWSLRHLAVGVNPSARHDNQPWLPSDSARRAKAGQALRISGALVEVRGDWLMMKEVFHMPGWKEVAGCCWLCTAKPSDFRDASSTASWRTQRLSHWDLMARIIRQGHELSPLMSAPGVRSHCFKVDWLHAMDQGVGADFCGNLFNMLLPKMPGRSKKMRVKALHMEIKSYYAEFDVQDKLQTLTPAMIQKKAAVPPKLRAKAAEVRALISFCKIAAEKHLDDGKPAENTAKAMARHLDALYSTLSADTLQRQQKMKEHSRKFCVLYSAMEQKYTDTSLWKIKPKFHLMQELCEMTPGACPSLSWTYTHTHTHTHTRTHTHTHPSITTFTHAFAASSTCTQVHRMICSR